MLLRTVAVATALLGGLCWVVRMVLALSGTDDGALYAVLTWGGLVLLAVATAGFGAGLVSSSATWLRAIVAVAVPLLVWSVLEVLHPAADPPVVDGVFALLVLAVAGAGAARLRSERAASASRRTHGAHAR